MAMGSGISSFERRVQRGGGGVHVFEDLTLFPRGGYLEKNEQQHEVTASSAAAR